MRDSGCLAAALIYGLKPPVSRVKEVTKGKDALRAERRSAARKGRFVAKHEGGGLRKE